MPAARKLLVDLVDGVLRARDEEVLEGDRPARRQSVLPREAARVPPRRRHANAIAAAVVDEEERLLAAHRRRLERRVGRARERCVRRRALGPCEDLVPHGVRPAADAAVAREPLLLRAVDHGTRPAVAHVPAAGELRPGGAVVHQRQRAAGDIDPAQRHGLRHGPEVGRGAAAVLTQGIDVDREVGQRAPEVRERDAVSGCQAAVVDLDLAVDHHVGRRVAETGDLRVVADLHLQRLLVGPVHARLEQQRVALGPHLVVDLPSVDAVHRRLDLADGGARVEDQRGLAEAGRPCGAGDRCVGQHQGRSEQQRGDESPPAAGVAVG